jgi:hypothetical protein
VGPVCAQAVAAARIIEIAIAMTSTRSSDLAAERV